MARRSRCRRCHEPVHRFTSEIGQQVQVVVTPVSVLDPLEDAAGCWEYLGRFGRWRSYRPPRQWHPVHRQHVCR